MRLERLSTHRFVGVLRFVLPLAVGVLIAMGAQDYWTRLKNQPKPPPKASPLARGLNLLSQGVTVTQMNVNRKAFTIHAKSNLGFSDNKSLVQDVDVTIYGKKDTDPPKHIHSKECSYDQKSQDIQSITCSGDVDLELDDDTHAQTQEAIYNGATGVITSSKAVRFERPNAVKGQANAFEYDLNSGLLNLSGDVKVQNADGVELNSDLASIHQKENWATASGNVLLKSQNGWVHGEHARSELTPLTHQPRSVTVDENVSAETHPPNGGDAMKIHAGWLQSTMSSKGVADHILARSNVRVEKISKDGTSVLTGGEAEASIGESGKFDLVEARNHAQMIFGADRSLSSDTIWTNADRAVETRSESELDVGTQVIKGSHFVIKQNGDVVTFVTRNPATLITDERQSSADSTEAVFDSRSNQLVGLKQNGHFQFTQGDRRGHSERARVEDNGSTYTLEGGAVVSDPKMHIEADSVRINQNNPKASTYLAIQNVKTMTADSDGVQVLVKADRAEGNSDKVLYTGNVHLWRDNAYIQSNAMDASQADKVLHARGNVRSDFDVVHATSDSMDLDNDAQVAHYVGNVHARKHQMIIDSADMVVKAVKLKNNSNALSEITAKGKVKLTKGEYKGVGDQVVYTAANDHAVLTGPTAEVNDKKGNLARSPRILVDLAGDKMAVLEGAGDQRPVSKYKVVKQ